MADTPLFDAADAYPSAPGHAKGSDTSAAGAAMIGLVANNMRQRVLDIVGTYENGCCRDVVLTVYASCYGSKPYPSTVAARLRELEMGGAIEVVQGVTVKGVSGCQQQVYRVTGKPYTPQPRVPVARYQQGWRDGLLELVKRVRADSAAHGGWGMTPALVEVLEKAEAMAVENVKGYQNAE